MTISNEPNEPLRHHLEPPVTGTQGPVSGFDFGLWVKNLADRQYVQYAIAQRDADQGGLGFDYGLVGEPRTYGADIRYRF